MGDVSVFFETGFESQAGLMIEHHSGGIDEARSPHNSEDLVTGSELYDSPLLIKNLFHSALAQYPEREIVSADRFRFSYLQLRRRIGSLASGMTNLGVRPGQTVAVMDWDTHRYLESFFTVPMLGAVLHTVNVRLAPAQILYTINHASDDWIFVHEDFLPIIEEIGGQITSRPRWVLLTDRDVDEQGVGALLKHPRIEFEAEYESLVAGGDEDFQFADFDEQTRATTFYTTGTTGDPKGVYYSHRQIILHTLCVSAGLAMASGHGRVHRNDVYMPITPMFHVHAWGMPFITTMMGLKQVYPGRYEPDRLLQLIEREQVTFSHCVPTILRMLLASPLSQTVDLSNWKVVVGGSALPRALAEEALALGIDVFSGFGMSETGPVLTIAQSDSVAEGENTGVETRCLSGRAVPLVQLSLIDSDGQPLTQFDGQQTGELLVRAPWLTRGYFRDQQSSDSLWAGGHLHTGDIASIDNRGYLLIKDRIKDVIKTGGEWISSVALEDLATRHAAVAEAAAIGLIDERWGERPVLLVVAAEANDADGSAKNAIIDGIKSIIQQAIDGGELSKWAMPDSIEFVSELPKTSVGKLDKKRMRLELDAGRGGDG